MKTLIKILFPYFQIFDTLKLEYQILVCDHDYLYWDTTFKEVKENGSLVKSRFPDLQCSHRQCCKCWKKERLNTTVGDWKWKRTNHDFPKHGTPFVVLYNPKGIKTKQQMRDELLNSILKKD